MLNNPFVMIYVRLVEKGLYTIDRVPENIREDVNQVLQDTDSEVK
ncbi:CD1375 family protein [Priestia filamentosa]